MGIFDTLKSIISPKTMNDSVFGMITFCRGQVWIGYVNFLSRARKIQVKITAGELGPNETQRQFFHQIEQKYPELSTDAAELLLETYRNYRPETSDDEVWNIFRLAGVSIPASMTPGEWQLSFDCNDDKDHSFDVIFKGWEAQTIAING
jgi:hypothetical protein